MSQPGADKLIQHSITMTFHIYTFHMLMMFHKINFSLSAVLMIIYYSCCCCAHFKILGFTCCYKLDWSCLYYKSFSEEMLFWRTVSHVGKLQEHFTGWEYFRLKKWIRLRNNKQKLMLRTVDPNLIWPEAVHNWTIDLCVLHWLLFPINDILFRGIQVERRNWHGGGKLMA